MDDTFDIRAHFDERPVLDLGYVALFDGMVSHPMLKVVNAARVSFLKESKTLSQKDEGLIRYLIAHEHFSTLRHSYFSFRIKAPICVFRQWWKYQVGSDWMEEGGSLGGNIEIPDTSWNEACLVGTTQVFHEKVWGGRRVKSSIPLQRLYELGSNPEWLQSIRIRCLDESTNTLVTGTAEKIVDRGYQAVYEIQTKSGRRITCTKSHRFLTPQGWVTMGDLLEPQVLPSGPVAFRGKQEVATNGKLVVDGSKFDEVIGVEYKGIQPTFDIVMNGPHHNFVADGFVVHNSGRYVEFTPEFYIPEVFRRQSKDNKQGSEGVQDRVDVGGGMMVQTRDHFRNACQTSYENYQVMVRSGVAKEQARMVLPQNLYSECIWTCSLQTILHFLHQRLKEDAQWEIREYAKAVMDLMRPLLLPGLVAEPPEEC